MIWIIKHNIDRLTDLLNDGLIWDYIISGKSVNPVEYRNVSKSSSPDPRHIFFLVCHVTISFVLIGWAVGTKARQHGLAGLKGSPRQKSWQVQKTLSTSKLVMDSLITTIFVIVSMSAQRVIAGPYKWDTLLHVYSKKLPHLVHTTRSANCAHKLLWYPPHMTHDYNWATNSIWR